MKILDLKWVISAHERIIDASGGSHGIRDMGALESAVNQPYLTFGGEDLYPSMVDKAVAMGFFLISNHPFVDGNKRIGYAVLLTILELNGKKINATIDEQEKIVLEVASGKFDRENFTKWVESHLV